MNHHFIRSIAETIIKKKKKKVIHVSYLLLSHKVNFLAISVKLW